MATAKAGTYHGRKHGCGGQRQEQKAGSRPGWGGGRSPGDRAIIESAAWMDTLGAVQKHGTFGGIGHCLQTFRSAWVAPLNAMNRTLKAAKVLIESGVGSVDAQPTAGNWQCVASWNQAQPDSMMVNAQADAHP